MAEPEKNEGTNYLTEVLGHPASVSGWLGVITAAAVISVAVGVGPAAIPVLLWSGAQSIAALFLPGSPVFREWIDRRKRAERREAARKQLVEEIQTRLAAHRFKGDALTQEVGRAGQAYERMRERLTAMAKMVTTQQAALSAYDLEHLDDATVDYLRLVYGRITLRERIDGQDERDLEKKLAVIERQLENTSGSVEQRKLEIAQSELKALIEKRAGLPAAEVAMGAQLLSMSEAFEDLYQHLQTQGGGADITRFLKDATERVEIEQEMSYNIDSELEGLMRRRTGASQSS